MKSPIRFGFWAVVLAALTLAGCSLGGDWSPTSPTAITGQPTDQSVVLGNMATFNVVANNAAGYQWQQSTNGGTTFADVVGATSNGYTTPATTLADSGNQYRVVVNGATNSVTSSAATLTVTVLVVAPAITVHPANQTIIEGQNASFSVTATGTSLSYQWQRSTDGGANFANLSGETNATLTRTAVPLADNGHQFRVVVSNSAGTATSNAATLTVNPTPVAPSFTTQPTNQSVTAPNTATFSSVATGTPTPTLQWQLSTDSGSNWGNIVGATASDYTTPATGVNDSGKQYRAVATNSAGTANSNAATLTVNPTPVAPSFTTQPTNQSVTAPNTATFSSVATGTPTPTLQWQLSTDSGSNWGNIVGATASDYTTPATGVNDSGKQYRAVATNSAGTANSNATTLTVGAPGPTDNWVTNGRVHAIARSADGNTIYLGGTFTQVGPRTGSFVAIDTTSGATSTTFPKVDGLVYASAPDGAGGWYIGGSFTLVGSSARANIAHILADGSVDATFNPNANKEVNAITVSGSTVYAGGWFTSIGGQARNHIAALDATTGLATTWDPNASSFVFTLTVSGSTVYVGGQFTSIGGQTRNNIAALDATTGLATTWDPNANGVVNTLSVSGSTVYVGGQFTSVGGQARNNIAALDATTSLATAWNPNASSAVNTITVSGSTVYVGGRFTSIGGQARNYIAALDSATGLSTVWDPNASVPADFVIYAVRTLAVSGNTVYAGGGFTSIGGQTRNNIAALDATTGLATTWDPNASSVVLTLTVSGSTVYAGGGFTSIGGQARNHIAALDATTGLVTAWNPNATPAAVIITSIWDLFGNVNALVVTGNTVYAGGVFTSIGGQTRNNIAALDATTGLATDWNPNANDTVRTLAISGSTVYVGGSFTSIGGQSRIYIAALDVTTGLASTWDPSVNGCGASPAVCTVRTLAVSGNTVYAGGGFTSIGGQTRNNIAALDATTGLATDWNPNANDMVRTLAISGSTVYVGGSFASIGGQSRSYIAALDVTTALATTWNPFAGFYVETIAVSGNAVYAGGWFSSIGAQTRLNIAAINASTGLASTWNPSASLGLVFALVASESTVYAGGSFSSINGEARSGIGFLAP